MLNISNELFGYMYRLFAIDHWHKTKKAVNLGWLNYLLLGIQSS